MDRNVDIKFVTSEMMYVQFRAVKLPLAVNVCIMWNALPQPYRTLLNHIASQRNSDL
jgi:hypothetical protein